VCAFETHFELWWLTCACARPSAANSTQKKAFRNESNEDLQQQQQQQRCVVNMTI
jgi:hypothetical protein